MNLLVNGEAHVVAPDTTIAALVRSLGRDPGRAGTAIARNGDVIPRRDWDDTILADGDAIEVVVAVGGG
jgi:sulfur carrier protein